MSEEVKYQSTLSGQELDHALRKLLEYKDIVVIGGEKPNGPVLWFNTSKEGV